MFPSSLLDTKGPIYNVSRVELLGNHHEKYNHPSIKSQIYKFKAAVFQAKEVGISSES